MKQFVFALNNLGYLKSILKVSFNLKHNIYKITILKPNNFNQRHWTSDHQKNLMSEMQTTTEYVSANAQDHSNEVIYDVLFILQLNC